MQIERKLLGKSGIYSLINIENGKRYIGSSKNLYNRLNDHLSLLRTNKSHNKHLQSSWNKNGEDNFIYSVLELCEEEIRFEREQYYIDIIHPEFNFSEQVIANTNRIISEEQKEKISNTLKQKYESGEISPYKQDHNWKKCYIYDIEAFTFYKECNTITEAFLELKTKYNTKEKIDTTIYQKKYCISFEYFESHIDIKNYICEKLFTRVSNVKEYLISEDILGNKNYHKNIQECANFVGSSRSTLNKHMDATIENPYFIKNSDYKIYFSKKFIPFSAVPIEESSELLLTNIGESCDANPEIND